MNRNNRHIEPIEYTATLRTSDHSESHKVITFDYAIPENYISHIDEPKQLRSGDTLFQMIGPCYPYVLRARTDRVIGYLSQYEDTLLHGLPAQLECATEDVLHYYDVYSGVLGKDVARHISRLALQNCVNPDPGVMQLNRERQRALLARREQAL